MSTATLRLKPFTKPWRPPKAPVRYPVRFIRATGTKVTDKPSPYFDKDKEKR